MGEELAYAIITPHSVRKSRTGNILSRLLSSTGLPLVAARLFAPGAQLVREYAAALERSAASSTSRSLLADYVRSGMVNHDEEGGRINRALLLVFRGPGAVHKLTEAVGEIHFSEGAARTIRDTYGEYLTDTDGNVVFFEPAVLIAHSVREVGEHLQLWAAHAAEDGGIIEGVPNPEPQSRENVERTLVLIKPDNFRYPNRRPGAVLDIFSQAGLNLIGVQLHRMSLVEAENFYAAVLPALQQAFKDSFADSLGDLIEEHFDTRLTPQERAAFGEVAGPIMGRKHWERLIHFMSGRNPSETAGDGSAHAEPGAETLLALVFEGPSAVGRIRALLGPTDPSQAPVGTVRREFGQTMMINAAHASDSAENAAREIGLLRIGRNDLAPLIEAWCGQPVPGPRGQDREANASPPHPSLTFPQ